MPIRPDGTVAVEIDTAAGQGSCTATRTTSTTITAEVTDESRRTIVGTGNVLVARKPFKVFAWVDRGHYRAGDTIEAGFSAQTLDRKPVEGKGTLTLLKITYDDERKPVETAVESWELDTDAEGQARQQIKAVGAGPVSALGHDRRRPRDTRSKGATCSRSPGEGFDGASFRFNDLELIPDKKEYQPGEKVKLLINTNQVNGTVLLFVRPTNGVYLPPKVVRSAAARARSRRSASSRATCRTSSSRR